MSPWEHLTEVPTDVRHTMTVAFIPWEKQDLVVENTIDLAINTKKVTEMACRTVRSSANSVRIPELCRIVYLAHPKLSKRNIFRAIGLFTGIHYKNVQKYYYNERRSQCSK